MRRLLGVVLPLLMVSGLLAPASVPAAADELGFHGLAALTGEAAYDAPVDPFMPRRYRFAFHGSAQVNYRGSNGVFGSASLVVSGSGGSDEPGEVTAGGIGTLGLRASGGAISFDVEGSYRRAGGSFTASLRGSLTDGAETRPVSIELVASVMPRDMSFTSFTFAGYFGITFRF